MRDTLVQLNKFVYIAGPMRGEVAEVEYLSMPNNGGNGGF